MSKVDWSKAPEDAQFYSFGRFRKHESDQEFLWHKRESCWVETDFAPKKWHKPQSTFEVHPDDFEMRPEPAVTSKNDTSEWAELIFKMVPGPEVKTYIGQMTADQLRNTKIRIESVEHGKAFLEMMFGVKPASAVRDAWLGKMSFLFFSGSIRMTAYEGLGSSYFDCHPNAEIKWQPAVSDKPTPEEEEAFAELEAKSDAKAKAKSERWNGEGLPPEGTICECAFFGTDEYIKVKALDAELNGKKAVVTIDEGGDFSQVLWGRKFRPIKSDREKWLESAMECLTLDDECTSEDVIGMIHDAMARGDLPAPKVEK